MSADDRKERVVDQLVNAAKFYAPGRGMAYIVET